MNSKLDYAKDCIGRGWVITPLHHGTKVTRYKWKDPGGQIRATDEAEFHWGEFPDDNIAIITSLSGLKVIDLDSAKHEVEGKYIQEILEYPTFTVRTRSGGFQYYYQANGVTEDRTGIVNGIDIKADGYVVAPGSVVGVLPKDELDAKKYPRVIPSIQNVTKGRYEVIEDIAISPLPDFSFLKEEMKPAKSPKAKNDFLQALQDQGGLNGSGTGVKRVIEGTEELERLTVALGYIKPDDYETWIKVGMAIKDAGGSVALWDDWSQSSPKWSAGECERRWKTFNKSGAGVGSIFYLAEQNGYSYKKTKKQESSEDEKKEYSIPKKLCLKATRNLSWFGDDTQRYPHYETGIEWFDEATRGIQDTTILTAPSNTGKTALALQIAKSVSKLGKPVLYIDFEQGSNGLYGRMLTNNTSYDTEDLMVRGKVLLEDPRFLEHYNQFNQDIQNVYITHLNQCENLGEVTEYIQQWQSTVEGRPLIIIDQIRGLSHKTGKDNLFEQTRMVAEWMQETPRNNGWTVLAISPQNKREDNEAEINAISGSSDLGYSVDCVISLRKKRKEKEDSTKKEDSYGGKTWSKKKELEPWDKKSVVLDIAKSRTPRSIITKELRIVAGELVPAGLAGKDLEHEVDSIF